MSVDSKTILITGGAGFIGSTVGSALMDAGYRVVVVDDLSTGREEFCRDRKLYVGDIADGRLIDRVARENPGIFAVVHCAASIVVPESVEQPVKYYKNNVAGTLSLVESLLRNGITRMVFSSSAAIYGVADDFTVDEDSPIEPSSPYARTKAHVEAMLADICQGTDLRLISLRYFNPIGADPKMRTGLALDKPSHALGMILTRDGQGLPFTVTGDTWPTRDGSGVRDYIHVWDLAVAHVAAIDNFDAVVAGPDGGCTHRAINLGTGTGTTVFELVQAYSRVVGHDVAVEVGPPRAGDVAGAYARTGRAARELGWKAGYSVDEGIRDTLRWFERRKEILSGLD